jgi:WD40 repeat protein
MDMGTPVLLVPTNGYADVVQSLAFTADGNTMVSASSDGSARVFDISMFK